MLSLNFAPFPVIETERLLLRSLSINDADEMYSLRTNKKVYLHLNKPMDESLEATKKKIEEILGMQQNNDAVFWVIAFKETPGHMIGNIGFWNISKGNYRAETGYMLHPDHWQKGIMKEVLKPVVEYGFKKMNLHSIEANVNPDNIASGALLESCGFEKEAYYKENYYYDGVFYDSAVYSRLNK